MYKVVTLALLLLPIMAQASDLLPPIEDMPIIRSSNKRYSDAAINFQKALFIQAGIASNFNLLRGWVNTKGDAVVNKVVSSTPAGNPVVATVVGTAYSIVVRKQISRSFRNPAFVHVNHDVTLAQDGFHVGVSIDF